MELESYRDQQKAWPAVGRHVLAHFDASTIVVYQAFRPQIADEALQRGWFGPSFSRTRMSWIKPNFLWMMYRCGWARKEGQERVLAVTLPRAFFDRVLIAAVSSAFDPASGRSHAQWSAAVGESDVRLQWDPDHDPAGAPVARRAVQLGLRGDVLAEYAKDAILRIDDATPLAVAQRPHAVSPFTALMVPRERVYTPADPRAARSIGLD